MNDRDVGRAAFIEERRQAGRESYSAILASAGDSAWDVVEPTHDRYLAGLLGLTRSGGTILDAACGTGKYWADIVASGRTVIGTDQLEGVLHDPLTVALVFDKTFCETTRLHIPTEFEPTPIDRDLLLRNDILRTIPKKLKPNMDVCVTVEADRFTNLFTDHIFGV